MKTKASIALVALALAAGACAEAGVDDDLDVDTTTSTTLATTEATTATTEADTGTDTGTTGTPGMLGEDDIAEIEEQADEIESRLEAAGADQAVLDVWAELRSQVGDVADRVREAGGEVDLDELDLEGLRTNIDSFDEAIEMARANLDDDVVAAWDEFRTMVESRLDAAS